MDAHDQISVIEALACLGDLPLDQLSELIKRLESKRIAAQQPVYSKGDDPDWVYFVGSGRLARFDEETYQGQLSRGDMAGWDSFYHQCPRDHSLLAQNDCFVYGLDRQNLQELIKDVPEILAGFLSAATPFPATGKPASNVAVNRQIGVFMFEDLESVSELVTQKFMQSYSDNPRVASFNCEAFCQLAGIGQAYENLSGHLAADVFAHLESDHDTVVYLANAHEPQTWRDKIVHQVDTLVVIVKDGTSALPTWFENLLKATGKRPGLVVLRTGSAEFGQSSRALWNVFEPEWHYRLHIDDTRRWASVGRMAQGRAINLVLSGGGCLGAIHCGILQALNDGNFPIDTIGGTSAGAGVAIGYALGDTTEEISRKFRYAFTEQKPFSAYTLPFYGLLSPKKLDHVLKEISEDRWLEESHIPIHATVTNLTQSTAEVLTTGPAWEAMRMSGSLPGILPPFIRNGYSYIDGGVMNNFPISVAKQKYGGRFVGVTFKIPSDDLVQCRYEDRPNSFQAVLSKLNLAKPNDYPGLGGVLANSLMLSNSSVLKDAINRVDLLLHPPVPHNVGVTSFERFDELYEIGVEYGRQYIADLKTSGSADDWIDF